MKWMKERDLLIAQTMAFVQSVTGKKPDAFVPEVSTPKPIPEAPEPVAEAPVPVADLPEPIVASPVAEVAVAAVPVVEIAPPVVEIEAVLTAAAVLAEQPTPAPIPRPEIPADFKSEIKARVASFRAQQQRFLREREEYCSTTMDKVRASLQEIAERRQNNK